MYEFIYYRVRHVMTRSPVTLRPDASLSDVEAVFEKHDFNGIPVVGERGELIGVVTKLDFLKAFVFTPESLVPHYEEILRRPAETVMTRDPRSVDPEMPLTRVLEDMVSTRFKSFPVVEGGRLVGVVAREDVLRGLRRAAAGERPEEESDER
jgi:CBS domain-containing protein